MAERADCPLCGLDAEAWWVPDRNGGGFECRACGVFYVPAQVIDHAPPRGHPKAVPLISIHSRGLAEKRKWKRPGVEHGFWVTSDLLEDPSSLGVEIPSTAEQVRNALAWLASRTSLGEAARVPFETVWPLLVTTSAEAARMLFGALAERSWAKEGDDGEFRLTVKGWEEAERGEAAEPPVATEIPAPATTELRPWVGRWVGGWTHKGKPRACVLEIEGGPSSAVATTITYHKQGTRTVVQQACDWRLVDDYLVLRGNGYRFIERGAARGWHLDEFTLRLSGDGRKLSGEKVDARRRESTGVAFHREPGPFPSPDIGAGAVDDAVAPPIETKSLRLPFLDKAFSSLAFEELVCDLETAVGNSAHLRGRSVSGIGR